jgi:hypothetical protein
MQLCKQGGYVLEGTIVNAENLPDGWEFFAQAIIPKREGNTSSLQISTLSVKSANPVWQQTMPATDTLGTDSLFVTVYGIRTLRKAKTIGRVSLLISTVADECANSHPSRPIIKRLPVLDKLGEAVKGVNGAQAFLTMELAVIAQSTLASPDVFQSKNGVLSPNYGPADLQEHFRQEDTSVHDPASPTGTRRVFQPNAGDVSPLYGSIRETPEPPASGARMRPSWPAPAGELSVTVVSAAHLPKTDMFGKCDPQIEVCLGAYTYLPRSST